jgi:hypothetical protein
MDLEFTCLVSVVKTIATQPPEYVPVLGLGYPLTGRLLIIFKNIAKIAKILLNRMSIVN